MKRIYNHLLFWICCLILEAYVEVTWINYAYPHVAAWKRLFNGIVAELLLFSIKIPLIYLSFYIIRNYALHQKKYVLAFFQLFISFALAALLSHLYVIYFAFPYLYNDFLDRPVFSGRIVNSFIDLIFIAGIANAVKQYRYQVVLRDHEKNLLKEKLTAELIFLKAQINPHFLFNTLNSLYALARRRSDQTADVILKLSALLRFILYEAEKKSISILQEITILENYIELEKIRYGSKLSVQFEKRIENNAFQITPLLLLPFIENAFKHGPAETREDSFIDIKLLLNVEGFFIFTVENSTENEITEMIENIGLKNVRRQLELLYPNHTLEISNSKNIFKINLIIKLISDDAL